MTDREFADRIIFCLFGIAALVAMDRCCKSVNESQKQFTDGGYSQCQTISGGNWYWKKSCLDH